MIWNEKKKSFIRMRKSNLVALFTFWVQNCSRLIFFLDLSLHILAFFKYVTFSVDVFLVTKNIVT